MSCMEIEINNQDNNQMVFTVEGADVSLVNALRRICMVEVPTLAIETVEFLKKRCTYIRRSIGPPTRNGTYQHRPGITGTGIRM